MKLHTKSQLSISIVKLLFVPETKVLDFTIIEAVYSASVIDILNVAAAQCPVINFARSSYVCYNSTLFFAATN